MMGSQRSTENAMDSRNPGPQLSDLVTIGIVTRNRWQDLETTLGMLARAGLGELPIHVFDDGSDQPCPIPQARLPVHLRLRRFDRSAGCVVRRNQLASDVKTKYLLSLDDDSYPVSGSLQTAVRLAEAHRDLLCLAFPIYNPVLGMHQSCSLSSQTYQVRAFTGCGHLMNLLHFRKIGGYQEELFHQGEEIDLAARAFQHGFNCYHFPGFQIHHTVSNQGRSWYRMDYFGSRNNLLWNDWYVPACAKLVQQARTISVRTLLACRVRRLALIKGICAGFVATARFRSYRKPFSMELYNLWNQLPC
jgi:hypothetical protein